MFVACGIWCLADVSSVSPSSELLLKAITAATHPLFNRNPVLVSNRIFTKEIKLYHKFFVLPFRVQFCINNEKGKPVKSKNFE